MTTVADRIKYIRTQATGKKLTLEEFGAKLGISKAAAFNLENPDRLPGGVPDSTIRLIAATFQVNYQWLTEGKEPMFLDMDADSLVDKYTPDESPYFRACVRGAISLSDKDWIKFRDFVEDMRSRLRSGKSDIES